MVFNTSIGKSITSGQFILLLSIYTRILVMISANRCPSNCSVSVGIIAHLYMKCDQKIFVILAFLWYTSGIANSSCFDISFISSIVAKCVPFIGVFNLERGKNQRGPSPANMMVEAWLRFCFWPKFSHKCRCMSWCVIMMQYPWLVFPNLMSFWRIAYGNRCITSR